LRGRRAASGRREPRPRTGDDVDDRVVQLLPALGQQLLQLQQRRVHLEVGGWLCLQLARGRSHLLGAVVQQAAHVGAAGLGGKRLRREG
jgi:hypothetical protein